MRILVVEDEPKLGRLLVRGLGEEGHPADLAATGEEALWMAAATPYDVIVLDVMLPGLDGFATCRELRARRIWTPVLMLTARDAIEDRIEGLDVGADDYLIKPFAFSELLARLRALARRVPAERPAELRVGDLRLDPASHRAWRADTELDLTAKEFVLFEVFMRRAGETLSRVQLLDAAWDIAFESHSNVVDVYVRYLRQKIDRPFRRHSLETVRGVGYRLVADEAAERARPRMRTPAAAPLGACVSRLPIRIRLTLPFALAMAVVLAGLGAFVYARVATTLLASTDQNLLAQANEATLRLQSGGPLLDRDATGAASVAQVIGAGGVVVSSVPNGLPALLGGAAVRSVLAGHALRETTTITGQAGRWRLLATRAQAGKLSEVLVLGGSLRDRDESLEHLRHELLFSSPLALLVATLAGYLLAGAALRPVEAMRKKAEAISAATPGSRLPVPQGKDEVSRLAETLNEMLARLETAFEHERRFIAEASHELRTPLALLRTELDLALRKPRSRDDLEAALRSAAEETDRLTALAADLLLIARSEEKAVPVHLETLSVRELLGTVAARFSSRAAELGREISVELDEELSLEADPRRVEQALGNLVDNAFLHGAGTVRLSPRGAAATSSSCTSPTRAAGFPWTSRPAPSTASAAPTRRAAAAAAGSGWRSSARSRSPTAAASASPARREAAPRSGSRSRSARPSRANAAAGT